VELAPAVRVTDLQKTYHVPHERYVSLKSHALGMFRSGGHEVLRALSDINFDVARGEFFGVLGLNGSGKSTLLRCIAGIYAPDSGSVTVNGRLSPFLEMGVGFKPELSARDNVLFNGTMLGLSKDQLHERLDDIIALADLDRFAEVKLKNFSSGMRVRLAFSLATQVDADVVLLDEVLAMGDAAFQEKCFAHFDALRDEGRSVLFVSHDMSSIRRFCDRGLLLDAGRISVVGDANSVADAYEELNQRTERERQAATQAAPGSAGTRVPRRGRAFAGANRPTVYRPAAFGGSLRELARLTMAFARTDFKLTYQDSVAGYLWSLMQPLLLFCVVYVVFGHFARVKLFDHYGVYVLSTVVLWNYFTEVIGGGVSSLVKNDGLMRKLRFPRVAIPLSTSLRGLFTLGLNSIVVIGFAVANGVAPRLSWLELPLLWLLLAILVTGVGMLLSTLYVRYRDVEQIWRLAERVLFFGTPIFYAATSYPESVRQLLAMTPLVMIFSEMRHAFVDADAPSAAALAGGTGHLLVPIAICGLVFLLGLWVFTKQAPRMAERV
jgi:ABC-type polysaccharide/polyol phosphate transport system ATPase subunit/ABC-type polysaccharide/polyol phosphate export permease